MVQPQVYQPQLQTPSRSAEPPLHIDSQTAQTPTVPLSLADLDKETIQNYSGDLGEEFAQELGLDLSANHHLHVLSISLESSINNEDQKNTPTTKEEQTQPNKSAFFQQSQRNTFLKHPIRWAQKENTQPRSQSGEELRHKPG